MPDFLAVANFVVEVGSVGATTEEGLAQVQRVDEVERLDKLGHPRVDLRPLLPPAFPDGDHMVTQGVEALGGAPWWRGGRRLWTDRRDNGRVLDGWENRRCARAQNTSRTHRWYWWVGRSCPLSRACWGPRTHPLGRA